MVPRRGGGLRRPGTRTDSRWSDVDLTRPLHRICNPEAFDDWCVEMDHVRQRECSPISGLFTCAHVTVADTVWLRGPYIQRVPYAQRNLL